MIKGEINSYLCSWFDYGTEKKSKKDYLLLKHAGDLIVSTLTYDWKMPVELQCVSASQALEAISKYKADLKSWSKTELEKNQKELMKRVEGMPKEFIEWVQLRLRQNSRSSKRLMLELMNRQKDVVEWLVPDVNAFISEQQKARNTYSHGSSSIAVDLFRLYRLAIGSALIAYSILWQLLGMNPSQIRRELERSRFKSWVVSWLCLQYPEQNLSDASRCDERGGSQVALK